MGNKIALVIVAVIETIAMLYLYPMWSTLLSNFYDVAIALVPSMQMQDKFAWYVMPYIFLGLIIFGGILYIANKVKGDSSLNG